MPRTWVWQLTNNSREKWSIGVKGKLVGWALSKFQCVLLLLYTVRVGLASLKHEARLFPHVTKLTHGGFQNRSPVHWNLHLKSNQRFGIKKNPCDWSRGNPEGVPESCHCSFCHQEPERVLQKNASVLVHLQSAIISAGTNLRKVCYRNMPEKMFQSLNI